MSAPETRSLPMFPLGTVLLPSALLPLRVFEERYLRMLDDILPDDPTFGVVLIERGSEVGGGETRTVVGTLARIAEARMEPGGHWSLLVVGTERIRVHEWLPDDPYPRALVELWPDRPESIDPETTTRIVSTVRRVLALRVEARLPTAPVDVDLPDDPGVLALAAAAMAGCGPADLQDLLCEEGARSRLDRCLALVHDQQLLLEALLADG